MNYYNQDTDKKDGCELTPFYAHDSCLDARLRSAVWTPDLDQFEKCTFFSDDYSMLIKMYGGVVPCYV